jgi:hypothetical protein
VTDNVNPIPLFSLDVEDDDEVEGEQADDDDDDDDVNVNDCCDVMDDRVGHGQQVCLFVVVGMKVFVTGDYDGR